MDILTFRRDQIDKVLSVTVLLVSDEDMASSRLRRADALGTPLTPSRLN